jgi:hypothetical protein
MRHFIHGNTLSIRKYIPMERLLAIQDRYHCRMRILFKEGDMLLQLDWDKNMLEIDLRTFDSMFKRRKASSV